MTQPVSVTGEYKFWTIVLGAACLSRALSYIFLPFPSDAVVAKMIGSIVSHDILAMLFAFLGGLLIVGALLHNIIVCLVGHMLALITYAFFTYSLILGIIQINADPTTLQVGWSGVTSVAVVTILHGWRVWKLGRDFGAQSDKK